MAGRWVMEYRPVRVVENGQLVERNVLEPKYIPSQAEHDALMHHIV